MVGDLDLREIKSMTTQEKIKFRNSWDNHLEKRFWKKLNKRNENIELIYLFDFCSLKSEIRVDENGILHLCFLFEERTKSGDRQIDNERSTNIEILKNIFFKILENNRNEKYIGFYRFSKAENYKDVLRALFIIGNELDDSELQNFMLDDKTKIIYEKFKNSNFNVDEIFDFYINEIVQEFEGIAVKVKNEIFENQILKENSEKLLRFPFLKYI
ncbi:MAG: hypothetical protein RR447_08860 [Algoriella sp.]